MPRLRLSANKIWTLKLRPLLISKSSAACDDRLTVASHSGFADVHLDHSTLAPMRGLGPQRLHHFANPFLFSGAKDDRSPGRETVIVLYPTPPDDATVASVDEKSHIQTLDRQDLGLPSKKGRCRTPGPGYKHNGTAVITHRLNVASRLESAL